MDKTAPSYASPIYLSSIDKEKARLITGLDQGHRILANKVKGVSFAAWMEHG
jgi:hypothetical protein